MLADPTTTPYRIGQERKNFTVNPSVAGHKYYISWLVAIGIKSFHRGIFEKIEFKVINYPKLFFGQNWAVRNIFVGLFVTYSTEMKQKFDF